MNIEFNKIGEFSISSTTKKPQDNYAFINSVVREGAAYDAQYKDIGLIATTDGVVFLNKKEKESSFSLEYVLEKKNLNLEINAKKFNGADVIEQYSTVRNDDKNLKYITQLAAANVNYVCYDKDGISKRLSDGSIVINVCQSKWEGEGQWKSFTPDDLGLYSRAYHSWEKAAFRIDSVSSWSSGELYPLVIIEDKKNNEAWYFELNGGISWFIEIFLIGGRNAKFLSVKLGGADERLGRVVKLEKGETLTSPVAVYGVTEGGFEEAVKQLTKYKRAVSAKTQLPSVIYNDYMNCNWACESDERILPLVDKAAEVGADVFCIDDGWQQALGLWYPANERFGKYGLQGVIDYIKNKGMTPGIWFEFESVPLALKDILKADDLFLTRNGAIVEPHRPLGNFRSKALIDYLFDRVDELYKMGVRYIKNDHNNTEFTGSTNYGEDAATELEKNSAAFLSFIDDLKVKYPDLIIENCGSGAMRSDNGTLSHFHLQSTSDQEDYLKNPSILTGTLALIPPEKSGIWSYPYPILFDDRNDEETWKTKLSDFTDGEQTAFNMVTSLLGKPFLSGKINHADDFNTKLIADAVKIAKDIQSFVSQSYPIFPNGRLRLCEEKPFAAGLINESETEIILAVWNLTDAFSSFSVNLKKYSAKSAEIVYPLTLPTDYDFKNGALYCNEMPPYSARLFRIKTTK